MVHSPRLDKFKTPTTIILMFCASSHRVEPQTYWDRLSVIERLSSFGGNIYCQYKLAH